MIPGFGEERLVLGVFLPRIQDDVDFSPVAVAAE